MGKHYALERKMLSYFGLIAAASLLITIEFVHAIYVVTPGQEALVSSLSVSEDPVAKVREGLLTLRAKALLMFAVQACVTLIVLVMFMRRITGPLQQMVETSRIISDGDLSRTIPIRTRDEIGLLGETINGLTSNIQEIVAFGLSTDSALRPLLEELRTRMGDDPVCGEQLAQIEKRLAGFRGILEGFKLLPAPLAATDADEKL